MNNNKIYSKNYSDLKKKQSLLLTEKIAMSEELIRCWHEAWNRKTYVSFSGGKDSVVLLNIIRNLFPDIPGVFVNTGLEYPEIISFVKQTENIITVRPKMSFSKVIEKYGYPVISKRIAQYVKDVKNAKGNTATKRLRLTGIKKNGDFSAMSMISKKWQFLCNAPFKISDKCCHYLKKEPLNRYEKETGYVPFIGNMADEGENRTQMYYRYGCNMYDVQQPMSHPLSFWTEKDIWEYIKIYNIPYSKIYDMGETRTGCMFCMFGMQFSKGLNKFQRMKNSHPKHWDYAVNKLGCGKVLNYIGIPYENKQMQLWD